MERKTLKHAFSWITWKRIEFHGLLGQKKVSTENKNLGDMWFWITRKKEKIRLKQVVERKLIPWKIVQSCKRQYSYAPLGWVWLVYMEIDEFLGISFHWKIFHINWVGCFLDFNRNLKNRQGKLYHEN